METVVKWQGGMEFAGSTGGHTVTLDSRPPLGKDKGFTPKELVAVGLAGCTAMDVVALLKKYRQKVDSFDVELKTTPSSQGHPVVFASAQLYFKAFGEIDKQKYLEAVQLSQTKYCGVSAMISKTVTIEYRVFLNDVEVGSGQADFA